MKRNTAHMFANSGGGAMPLPAARTRPEECFFLPEWDVAHLPHLDSTNAEARRRIEHGLTGKCVIIADSQSAGQCRHDRLWESAPGLGLWASFILPVSVSSERLAQSSLVLAVAVREAVSVSCDVALAAKWPNDLLHDGKKCCGLLVETGPLGEPGAPIPLILGVGINIAHSEQDFPEYLRGAATSLHMAGGGRYRREAVLYAVAAEIDYWFSLWERRGFDPVRKAWLEHNCTMGREISLPEGYGHSRATAQDIDDAGALVALAGNGAVVRVDSGEILFANKNRRS